MLLLKPKQSWSRIFQHIVWMSVWPNTWRNLVLLSPGLRPPWGVPPCPNNITDSIIIITNNPLSTLIYYEFLSTHGQHFNTHSSLVHSSQLHHLQGTGLLLHNSCKYLLGTDKRDVYPNSLLQCRKKQIHIMSFVCSEIIKAMGYCLES